MMYLLFLFIGLTFGQKETSHKVQVTSGVYLREAPSTVLLYSEFAYILFDINYGFTPYDDFSHDLLLDECGREANDEFFESCLMALPILSNIEGLTFKNNKQFEAITGKLAFKIEEKANFNTNVKSRAGRTRLTQEVENPVDETMSERTRRDTRKPRKERQIMATGLVAGYLGGLVYNFFGKTSVDSNEMFEEITKGMDINSQNMIHIASSVDLLKSQTNYTMHKISNEFNRKILAVKENSEVHINSLKKGEIRQMLLITDFLQQTVRFNEHFEYSQILAACTKAKLPPMAISPTKLLKELKTLNESLTFHNMTFGIPLSQLSKYYFHQLTQCHFNHEKQSLLITLKVPIKQKEISYSLLESITVPFLHFMTDGSKQICHIENQHELFVMARGRNQTDIIPIDQSKSSFCDLKADICYFSELSSSARKATDCSKALLTGVDSDTLSEMCPMNCRLAGNEVSIISLNNKNPDGEKVFAVTNANNNTELVCRKGSTGEVVSRQNFYEETHTIGTYIIRITNCNCAIETNSRVYRIPHPCRIVTEQKNAIRIAIPSRWTNLAKSQIVKAITVEKELVMATLFTNFNQLIN
jgi:hypothetical protein